MIIDKKKAKSLRGLKNIRNKYNERKEVTDKQINEIIGNKVDYLAIVLIKNDGAKNEINQLVSNDKSKIYDKLDELKNDGAFYDYEILVCVSVNSDDLIRI